MAEDYLGRDIGEGIDQNDLRSGMLSNTSRKLPGPDDRQDKTKEEKFRDIVEKHMEKLSESMKSLVDQSKEYAEAVIKMSEEIRDKQSPETPTQPTVQDFASNSQSDPIDFDLSDLDDGISALVKQGNQSYKEEKRTNSILKSVENFLFKNSKIPDSNSQDSYSPSVAAAAGGGGGGNRIPPRDGHGYGSDGHDPNARRSDHYFQMTYRWFAYTRGILENLKHGSPYKVEHGILSSLKNQNDFMKDMSKVAYQTSGLQGGKGSGVLGEFMTAAQNDFLMRERFTKDVSAFGHTIEEYQDTLLRFSRGMGRSQRENYRMAKASSNLAYMIGVELDQTNQLFEELRFNAQASSSFIEAMSFTMQLAGRNSQLTSQALADTVKNLQGTIKGMRDAGRLTVGSAAAMTDLAVQFKKLGIEEFGQQFMEATSGFEGFSNANDQMKAFITQVAGSNQEVIQAIFSGKFAGDKAMQQEFAASAERTLKNYVESYLTPEKMEQIGIKPGGDYDLQEAISKLDGDIKTNLNLFSQQAFGGIGIDAAARAIKGLEEGSTTLGMRMKQYGDDLRKQGLDEANVREQINKRFSADVQKMSGVAFGQLAEILETAKDDSISLSQVFSQFADSDMLQQLRSTLQDIGYQDVNTEQGMISALEKAMAKNAEQAGADTTAIREAFKSGNQEKISQAIESLQTIIQKDEKQRLKETTPFEKVTQDAMEWINYMKSLGGEAQSTFYGMVGFRLVEIVGWLNLIGSSIGLFGAVGLAKLGLSIGGILTKGFGNILSIGKSILGGIFKSKAATATAGAVARGVSGAARRARGSRVGTKVSAVAFRVADKTAKTFSGGFLSRLSKFLGPAAIALDAGFRTKDYLDTQGQLQRGEITQEEASQKTRQNVAGFAGGIGGGLAGAKMGAVIGTFAGPIGTAIGGLVGGVLGYIVGDKLMSSLVEVVYGFAKKVGEFVGSIGSMFVGAIDWIKDAFGKAQDWIASKFSWFFGKQEEERTKKLDAQQAVVAQQHKEKGFSLAHDDPNNPKKQEWQDRHSLETRLVDSTQQIAKSVELGDQSAFGSKINSALSDAVSSKERFSVQGGDQWTPLIQSIESAKAKGLSLDQNSSKLYDQLRAMDRRESMEGAVRSDLSRQGQVVGVNTTKEEFDQKVLQEVTKRLDSQGFNADGTEKQIKAAEAMLTPGSIYVHDTHVERLLESLFSNNKGEMMGKVAVALGGTNPREDVSASYDNVVRNQEAIAETRLAMPAQNPSTIQENIVREKAAEQPKPGVIDSPHIEEIAENSEFHNQTLLKLLDVLKDVRDALRPSSSGGIYNSPGSTKGNPKPRTPPKYFNLPAGVRDSSQKNYIGGN